MASRAVLVIHAADQEASEPLAGHQEKHECGCGWWDYTHLKDEPQRIPVETLGQVDQYGVICLPDGQLLFRPDEWPDERWNELLQLLLVNYPGHLASIIWCHS
jgi:hypothetical protein